VNCIPLGYCSLLLSISFSLSLSHSVRLLQSESSSFSSSDLAFASVRGTTSTTFTSPRPHHHPPPTATPPSGDSQGHLPIQMPGLEHLAFRFKGAVDGVNKVDEVVLVGGASSIGGSSGGLAPCGSVTKMTLKDNHLIVVTEERHVSSLVIR